MKLFLIAASAVAMSAALAAQTPPPAAGPPTHLSAAGQMQSQYNIVKSNLTKTADAMPADDYAFKPTPDVRTFAANVAHTSPPETSACARTCLGKPNPNVANVDLEKTATTKTDVIKALADSFAFCEAFVAARAGADSRHVQGHVGRSRRSGRRSRWRVAACSPISSSTTTRCTATWPCTSGSRGSCRPRATGASAAAVAGSRLGRSCQNVRRKCSRARSTF